MSYEELVRQPGATLRQLCTALHLPASEDAATIDATISLMCHPYTEGNISSFSPIAPGALAATDPTLLNRRHVDATQVTH